MYLYHEEAMLQRKILWYKTDILSSSSINHFDV